MGLCPKEVGALEGSQAPSGHCGEHTHWWEREVLRVERPRPLHGFRKGKMEAEAGALFLVGSLGCQPGLSGAMQVGHLHHVALLRLALGLLSPACGEAPAWHMQGREG